MCGIFGVWHREGSPLSLASVRAATDLLRHRGPDDEGYLCYHVRTGRAVSCAGTGTMTGIQLPSLDEVGEQPVDLAFGFRRLSIIDLSEAGHQPMSTADGRYWIIFNGEIYNHIELRNELQDAGHRFRSHSDTEVLLAAYAHWGRQALTRLVGMFACAILDTRERRLFLARDHFGIKPLYYLSSQNRFAFASEIKALLNLPDVRRVVNADRLYLYLRHGLTDHGADTMFAEIRQLPAAHYMEITLEGSSSFEPVRYWQPDLDRRETASFEEAAVELHELFLENIRLHLRSDVAVGAALSGGMDSSSIVGAMRYVEGSQLDLHAFTHVAEEPSINEEHWADLAAQAAGAVIHKTRPTADELVADLDRVIAIHDEPFGSTSIYAQYRVFALARHCGIKVMLDGQGADELLAGYKGYAAARMASLVTAWRWIEAARFLKRASRWPGRNRLWMETGQFLLHPILQNPIRRLVGQPLLPAWLNGSWFAAREVVPTPLRARRSPDVLRHELHHTLTVTSLPMLLRYEDRDSMAHSVESRVPFLTPDLVNYVLGLPEEFILDGEGASKAILRRAMRGIVPDVILDRKDKIGFSTSEQRWLTGLRPWVDRTLHSEAAAAIPAIERGAMHAEWRSILDGTKAFDFRVWRWLNLIRWTELFGVIYE